MLYLVGSLVQGLGLLLIQPFAIRVLDAEQWGFVSTSVVTIQVVVVLISAGLPLAITRLWFDPMNGELRSKGMYGFLALSAMSLGVMAAIGIILGASISGAEALWPMVLAMLGIGLLGSVLGSQAVLRAQNRPLAFVVLSLISSVAANLAGLGSVILLSPTATAYLGAYIAVVAASAAVAISLVRPVLPWRVAGAFRESISLALPLLPHTGALMLLTQGSVLLLASVTGAVPAGQFGAVLIFVLGPMTVLNALNNAWSTRLMEAGNDKLHLVLRPIATQALCASAAVGLLASAAAAAGSIVLTVDPAELALVARTLPLVSVGYGLFLIATNVVYIVHRTHMMALVTPLVLLLSTAAAVPYAVSGDLLGVALVQGASFFLLGVAYWLLVRRPTSGLWPLRLFVLLLAIHCTTVMLLDLLPVTLLSGMLQIGAVGLVLAASVLLFRVKENRGRKIRAYK